MKPTVKVALSALLLLSTGQVFAGDSKVSLTGKEEAPAVETMATGTGTITVGADKSVSGSVTTKGVEGVAAHIHQAAAGKKPADRVAGENRRWRLERAERFQADRGAGGRLQGRRVVRERPQRRAQGRRDSRPDQALKVPRTLPCFASVRSAAARRRIVRSRPPRAGTPVDRPSRTARAAGTDTHEGVVERALRIPIQQVL